MRRSALAIAFLLLPACSSSSTSSGTSPPATTGSLSPLAAQCLDKAGGGTIVEAQAVKDCLAKPGADIANCLDGLFQEFLKTHTTQQALALLQCYGDHDNGIEIACHPVSHAIGRDTFAIKNSVDTSFAACDQTCHSGCYHGVMERFLRGDAADQGGHISFAEIQSKVATACPTTLDSRTRFQCLHGLGHAILYYSGYDLRGSLTLCESTGDDWAKSSCRGGVFMENLVAAESDKRDVSPTDYHYPCDAIDDAYKNDCYVMQTSRMTEMGLTPPQIFEECRKADAYALTCISSLGRDLSNDARVGDARGASQTCEIGQGDEVSACTRGVVYALVDNTWDGKFAMPYCPTYASADAVAYCFAASVSYLQDVYSKTADDIRSECAQYAPAAAGCAAAAK